jgi:TolB protein
MNESRDVLDRLAPLFPPPERAFDGFQRRREQKRRNRRVGSAIVALVVIGATAVALGEAFASKHPRVPATHPPPGSNGRIAFVSPGNCPLGNRLYTVAPDGTDLQPLIGETEVEYPDWSPDGSTIAFDDGSVICVPDWSTSIGHIFTVRADGSGLKQVTSGIGAELTPDWSPDGTHLAVTAEGEDGLPAGIFVVDVATGTMRPVTANPYPGYLDKEPDYSPEGTQITFVRDRRLVYVGASTNQSALFVANVDGSGLRRLTPWGMGLTGTPSWSPDGSRIVFRSGSVVPPPGARLAQIYVVGADGTGLRQLTFDGNAASYWPSWSPDGTRIVFTRYVFNPDSPDGKPDQPARLYTMRPDGSGVAPFGPTSLPEETNEAAWGTHP